MCITRGLANNRSQDSLIKLNAKASIRKESIKISEEEKVDRRDEPLEDGNIGKQPKLTPAQAVPDKATSALCSVKDEGDHTKTETIQSDEERKSRYFVQHKRYVDRSEDVPEILPLDKKARGGNTIPFPLRLHQMLDDVENAGLTFIVSWSSHGRAFMVHKRVEFVERVLPVYFQQHKFASFQRQLNLYGFSRISTGKDKGVYYHESFLKGRQLLTTKMTRTKVKGNSTRGSSNPYAEPDFYIMKPLGLLKKETLNKIYDVQCNLINEHMAQVLDEEIIKMFSSQKQNSFFSYNTVLSSVVSMDNSLNIACFPRE